MTGGGRGWFPLFVNLDSRNGSISITGKVTRLISVNTI